MEILEIKTIYNGININGTFRKGLNILVGYSGTGKSLLLAAVDLYCIQNDIKCILCNYNDAILSEDKIINICRGFDIVLLDNADLYITNDILINIRNMAEIVIMSMKNTSAISTGDAREYIVEYDKLRLDAEEI